MSTARSEETRIGFGPPPDLAGCARRAGVPASSRATPSFPLGAGWGDVEGGGSITAGRGAGPVRLGTPVAGGGVAVAGRLKVVIPNDVRRSADEVVLAGATATKDDLVPEATRWTTGSTVLPDVVVPDVVVPDVVFPAVVVPVVVPPPAGGLVAVVVVDPALVVVVVVDDGGSVVVTGSVVVVVSGSVVVVEVSSPTVVVLVVVVSSTTCPGRWCAHAGPVHARTNRIEASVVPAAASCGPRPMLDIRRSLWLRRVLRMSGSCHGDTMGSTRGQPHWTTTATRSFGARS
ncbi:MAG TPA: hypothetical protein VMZ51_04935 [Acidimicrobiales bacterium]|nr:hypothetical protein [Acidimicrobiales bacterium]